MAAPNSRLADPTRGRLLIASAAVLWSTSGFFAQAPIFDDWPVAQRGALLAFWRALFATAVLLPLVRRPRWRWGLAPMSLTFLAMNVAFVSALVLGSAASAIWLQYTSPAWVFLVGIVWLHERATSRDWQFLLCAMSGVAVIVGGGLLGGASSPSTYHSTVGVLCGLLSGLFFAGVVLWLRFLRDEDPAWLAAVNHGVTALALLPFAVACGIWPTPKQLIYLAAFGGLQMGLPYLLFARGLRHVSSHEAAGIALLEPLLVPLWVGWAWHGTASYHPPQWWTFLGAGLILAGLVLKYRPKLELSAPP
jgi:drug/metabolite transporter (DMT)-like permease